MLTTGGGEAVETAWKPAKQYFKKTGKPTKHKVISRSLAHHGTSQGAPPTTGIPGANQEFEPLPAVIKVPTRSSTARRNTPTTSPRSGAGWRTKWREPSTWRGRTPRPRCPRSRCRTPGDAFLPHPGSRQRFRESCDRYDVLLLSDQVICAFGRFDHGFRARHCDYQPDITTVAKGLTSGCAPLDAMIA